MFEAAKKAAGSAARHCSGLSEPLTISRERSLRLPLACGRASWAQARPCTALATCRGNMPLVRGPVFDLLLLELLELLDGRATLRLLALCRDARRPEWAARGAAARRLAEDFAAFLQGARVRLPGFELCDFLEARACWDFNEERANHFRPPAFLAGAFCAGSQFQMRRWIDRYWRLRGLDPMEVLQRLNFFDLLGGPEFDFYLGLLRKGQARFIYSREVDRPGDFRGCLAAGDEDDEEPPFDAGLAIVFRCDHFLTAVCARQARPARPR